MHNRPEYQIFMLALCIYALGVLATETVFTLDQQTRTIFDVADYGVCAVFFVDFLVSLAVAPNRRWYLMTWGWIDLLSSIPAVALVRWGRLARCARIVRVLRGVKAARHLSEAVLKRRAENTFLTVSLLSILLIVFSSVAILNFETDGRSNIKTAEDALWWAVATITTAGFGDLYPVTPEGRVLAAVVMCAGVALFSTFSGFLAACFIAPGESEQNTELSEIREELRALRRLIEQQGEANGKK